MLKLFLTATITLLVTLATLTACSATTPAPEEVPTPIQVSAKVPAPAPTDVTGTHPEPQAERPTAAPTATPASTPADAEGDKHHDAPNGRITPSPDALDSGAFRSALSDAELACIGENTERQTRFFGCLNDETIDRIFLAGFVPGPGPLSQETSDCVRAAFAVIDPREVMTAGIEGDPGRAMAGSMAALSVTVACLTDQEWEETAPMLEMSPDERAGMQCLMEALGGPGQMAAAMTAAQEGEFAELARGSGAGWRGTSARAAARHSTTGAQGDHGSVHAGVHGDNRGDAREGQHRPRRPRGQHRRWDNRGNTARRPRLRGNTARDARDNRGNTAETPRQPGQHHPRRPRQPQHRDHNRSVRRL